VKLCLKVTKWRYWRQLWRPLQDRTDMNPRIIRLSRGQSRWICVYAIMHRRGTRDHLSFGAPLRPPKRWIVHYFTLPSINRQIRSPSPEIGCLSGNSTLVPAISFASLSLSWIDFLFFRDLHAVNRKLRYHVNYNLGLLVLLCVWYAYLRKEFCWGI